MVPTVEELKRMSRFCIGLYRTGKVIQSAHIASNILELIIDLWLDKQNIHYANEDNLNYKINILNYSNLYHKKSELHELREIRNDIVHGYIHSKDFSKVHILIDFIFYELDYDSYEKYNDITELDLGTAYYWIREFEVLDTKSVEDLYENTTVIKKDDFNNLYKIAERFKALSTFISGNKRLGKYYPLTVDNISSVNSTSAYVWLAITSGSYKGREKISSGSISILATPENLRIYIDFGGFAFEDREKYFRFLKNTDTNILNIQDINDLYLFDIEWYSYIENKVSINFLNTNEKDEKISSSKKLLDNHNKNKPLPSNRLLIGYILEKKDLRFDDVWSKLNSIICIYEKYKDFK